MRSTLALLAATAILAVASLTLLSGCNQSYAERVVSVGVDELTIADGSRGLPKTHEVAPDAEIVLDGEPAELKDIQPGDAVRLTTELQGDQKVAVRIDAKRSQTEDAVDDSGIGGAPLMPPALSPLPGEIQEPLKSREDPSALPGPTEKQTGPESDEPARSDKDEPGDAEDPNVTPPNLEKSDEPVRSNEDEPGAAEDEKATAPNPEAGAETLFHGEVRSVQPDLLRIRADADLTQLATEMTFAIAEDAEIFVAGKPAGPENLVEGMTVTVLATKNGDRVVAVRIDAEPMPV
jgi:hypothetical protein